MPEDAVIQGASGARYTFVVHSRHARLDPLAAVYLLAKSSPKASGREVRVIYVGQTPALHADLAQHPRLRCFDEHGANALLILEETDERKRELIEADILFRLSPPCNGRIPDPPDAV